SQAGARAPDGARRADRVCGGSSVAWVRLSLSGRTAGDWGFVRQHWTARSSFRRRPNPVPLQSNELVPGFRRDDEEAAKLRLAVARRRRVVLEQSLGRAQEIGIAAQRGRAEVCAGCVQ